VIVTSKSPQTSSIKVRSNIRNSVDEPNFVVAKGKRPGVDDYGNNYTYSPGDRVYLVISGCKEGPYKIEGANDGRYTLCNDSGVTVENGQAYHENQLELYDPFA
jgi:hypothetical protein